MLTFETFNDAGSKKPAHIFDDPVRRVRARGCSYTHANPACAVVLGSPTRWVPIRAGHLSWGVDVENSIIGHESPERGGGSIASFRPPACESGARAWPASAGIDRGPQPPSQGHAPRPELAMHSDGGLVKEKGAFIFRFRHDSKHSVQSSQRQKCRDSQRELHQAPRY